MSRAFRPPISVFLAHPDERVRAKLGDEIAGTGITVIGEAGDGREATSRILELAPDVAMIATDLPEVPGVEVCRAVRETMPVCRVLMLAGSDGDEAFDACLLGALGCFVIGAPQVPLVKAVRGTMRHESLPTRTWATRILERYAELGSSESARIVPAPKLTPAETDVLRRIAGGDKPDQVAEALATTTRSVRLHAGNAIIKLARAQHDERHVEALRASRS